MTLLKPVPRKLLKAAQDALELAWWEICKALTFDRDRGLCRCCRERGSDPHHLKFRSLQGKDETQNVATLCRRCHEAVQEHRIACVWSNANYPQGVLFGSAARAEDAQAIVDAAKVPVVDVTVVDRQARRKVFELRVPLPFEVPVFRREKVSRLVLTKDRDAEGRPVYLELSL